MRGEIITDGEMTQAMELASKVNAVAIAFPATEPSLKPVYDFLLALAWKGQER